MTARSSFISPKRERELAELAGQMLEISGLGEARLLALRLVSSWLGTDCNFWVKEPRNLGPLTPADEPLLATLQPIDMIKMGEPVAMQRRYNPFMKRAMEGKVTTPFSPVDVISNQAWERNPFRTEVCQPLGAAQTMAIEVEEIPGHNASVFVIVTGREKRVFNAVERYWFERIKWTVQPIVQHLRSKGPNHAVLEWADAPGLVGELPFTPREREVFHWMLEGKRNKEIAIILDCSPSTIKKHVASILSKTGAETRAGAVRASVRA
jgi:DNA-binding CsgD family transcriptional regulator